MATIANLAVSLSANTAKYSAGLKRASKQTRGFTMDIKRMAKRAGAFAAIAGGAAATGLSVLVKRQFQIIDGLAKMSDKIGIATEELAGLRHAGELSGVAVNTVDMALQRMTRRVSEAADGTGEAVKAIRELGLNAAELERDGPAEAMRKIADAMKGVESQSDRVRLAMKLFDSEGVSLVNTLAQGREGLDAATEEAKALGIAFSRVDARMIERANDSMNRLGKLVQGVVARITIKLAPYVEAIATKLVEWGTEGNRAGRYIATGIKWATQGIAKMADVANSVLLIWRGLRLAIARVVETATKGVQTLLDMIDDALVLIGDEPRVGEAFKSYSEGFAKTAEDAQKAFDKTLADVRNKTGSKALLRFFEDVEAKARKAAEEIANAANNPKLATIADMVSGGDGESPASRTFSASQISLSRSAAGFDESRAMQERSRHMKEQERQTQAQETLVDLLRQVLKQRSPGRVT